MNTKHQTVWLVSMLSLMVVLSAYYLFTEDVDNLDLSASDINVEEVKLDASEASKQTDAANKGVVEQNGEAEKVQANVKSGSEHIAGLQLEQMTAMGKRMEELSTIAADTKRPKEETAKAAEELRKLEDDYEKITYIQDKLGTELKFAQTVVMQENDKWSVYVQDDKLEKSEVVSIATLMMQELKARPDQITVKVVR